MALAEDDLGAASRQLAALAVAEPGPHGVEIAMRTGGRRRRFRRGGDGGSRGHGSRGFHARGAERADRSEETAVRGDVVEDVFVEGHGRDDGPISGQRGSYLRSA